MELATPRTEWRAPHPYAVGTFFRRHGIVRATQWNEHGDHPAVGPGVHVSGGTLDINRATPYTRRHVERGDWIVAEGDGRLSVVRDDEFQRNYRGL